MIDHSANGLLRLVYHLSVILLATVTPAHTSFSEERESPVGSPLPMTGAAVPEMAAFDRLVPELMQKYEIPGGAVAVAKDGRLVLARGYGLADVERNQPVEPDALFRIASISKPITAAAILVLVEEGRLQLEAKALDLLGPMEPMDGESIDPRFGEITVRHLLQHTAGFDREQSFDPMFQPVRIARAVGVEGPPGAREIVRFMLARPLDFAPGERYAYSNFGYCLLGRLIEQVTGESYEQAVKRLVFEPIGITRMQLGRTRLAERAAGEVRYYSFPGSESVDSVFPDVPRQVPRPYGGFCLEAMDAHGGWIASSIDLVRFATSIKGERKGGLLKPETSRLIDDRSGPRTSPDSPVIYGLGWTVRPVAEGSNWFHAGSLPGTSALLVRTHHALAWAALFNSRPRDDKQFRRDLDRTLWKAANQVTTWPKHDLFEQYR